MCRPVKVTHPHVHNPNMATLTWKSSGLLSMDNSLGESVYSWTPSSFEEYVGDVVSPSMYTFMVGWVKDQNPAFDENGMYQSGALERGAVDAYFNLPWKVRVQYHEEELEDLKGALEELQAIKAEHVSVRAMAYSNTPEYEGLTDLITEAARDCRNTEAEIQEEECWLIFAPRDQPMLYDGGDEI